MLPRVQTLNIERNKRSWGTDAILLTEDTLDDRKMEPEGRTTVVPGGKEGRGPWGVSVQWDQRFSVVR